MVSRRSEAAIGRRRTSPLAYTFVSPAYRTPSEFELLRPWKRGPPTSDEPEPCGCGTAGTGGASWRRRKVLARVTLALSARRIDGVRGFSLSFGLGLNLLGPPFVLGAAGSDEPVWVCVEAEVASADRLDP